MNESNPLTKAQAVRLYDNNQAALARALGVTRQAINKLPEGPLPKWMDLELRFVLQPKRGTPAAAGKMA